MRYIRCVFLLVVSGLLFTPNASAGPQPDLKFDHVLDLGVPGAQTFLQDRDGFLWFGSDGGGMFRYDGYELKHYGVGSGALSNGNVWRICEDPENPDILWIGTSGGLNRLDTSVETFSHYVHAPQDPNSLGDNTVQDIVPDSVEPNILWLGTAAGGLNKFDKHTGKVTRYLPAPAHPQSIAFPDVWRLIEDRTDPNILWIGTYGGGLDRFNKTTGIFTHYQHDPENPQSLSAKDNNIDALVQDKDRPQILWIGTPEDGLDKFDTRTGTFTNYPADQTNGEVALIYDDGKGTLWLGGYVMNNGLTLFDKQTGTITNYRHNPDVRNSLGNDLVVNVYEDRAGIYWITTYSGIIDKIDPSTQNFTWYKHSPNVPNSLSNSAVTSLYEDRQGLLWIGTQGGLNAFDRNTHTFTRYMREADNPQSLDADYILGSYEDSEGDFWVSSYVGPLTNFDRTTGSVIARYEGDAESLTTIIEDPRNPGLLWMGTHMAGLAQFDKRTGIFTFYLPDPEHPEQGPANTYIQTMIHDAHEDALWFGGSFGGSFGGGLNKFNQQTGMFTHYFADPSDPSSLSADAIAALYQDKSGTLWIGTKGGGLNRFDTQTETFTQYTQQHGVSPEVNGILADQTGKLWLSTNNGIILFNPATEKSERRYTQGDGLQGDAFLPGSALKTRDGRLWFGGTNGVNAFEPGSLVRNLYVPPVAIISLTQRGEAIPEANRTVPARLENLTLPWRRNFFEFEYVALNYTNAKDNRYKYMLEGFDQDWYDAGTRRFGRYSNLPGGTYTLRVLGSNNDGVWNADGAALKIVVSSPLWETWWVRIFGVVAIVGIVFWIHDIRVKTIEKRNRLLERLVKERTHALEEQTAQVQESETRFRRLSEASFEGILIHEQEQLLDFNEAFVRMWAYQRAELLYKNGLELFTPATRDLVLQKIMTGDEQLYEAEGLRKDGSKFPVEIQARALPYEGRIVRVAAIRNISSRKEAEAQLRFQAELLDQIQDSIVTIDLDGNIIYLNEAAARGGNLTRSTLLGDTLRQVGDDPSNGVSLQEILEETLAHGSWEGLVVNYSDDGTEQILESHTWIMRNTSGEPTGMISVSTDITDRTLKEKELQTILKTAHDGFSLIDTQGRYLDVNDAYCRMLGYTREELFAHTISDINITYQAPQEALQRIEHVKNIGKGLFDSKLRRKDGRIIDVEISANYMDVSGGRVVAFVRDITQRKHAEDALRESEEKFREMADLMPQIIYEMDLQGNLTYVNQQSFALMGYTPEDVRKGVNVFQMLHLEDHERARRNIAEILAGTKSGPHEYLVVRKDGSEFPVLINSAPIIRQQRPAGLRGIIVDITERKQVEETLRQAQKASDKAKIEAEAASRVKSEFLARMSHELRTPMNVITGMSYTALQTALTAKQRESLEAIQLASRTLSGMIENIFDFSKIESGTLKIEPAGFQLHEMLGHVFNLVRAEAEKKHLEMRIEANQNVPLSLIGDSVRLEQILIHLAQNAVKFTEIGEVVMRVEVEQESEIPTGSGFSGERIQLRFSVQDSGIGISTENLGGLFEPLTQVDGSSTRKYGGTGLGLALCKHLVEMMDGRIWVESGPGQGSTFFFTAVFGRIPGGKAMVTQAPLLFNTPRHAGKTVEGSSEHLHDGQDGFPNVSTVEPLLTELASLLKEGDVEASHYLGTLRENLQRTSLAGQFRTLEVHIGNYEFEEARQIVNDMLTALKRSESELV